MFSNVKYDDTAVAEFAMSDRDRELNSLKGQVQQQQIQITELQEQLSKAVEEIKQQQDVRSE